jgi:hypothetical protein
LPSSCHSLIKKGIVSFPDSTHFEPRERHYEQLHIGDEEESEWQFATAHYAQQSNTELKPMEEWLAESGMMFQSSEALCTPCGIWKKCGKKIEKTGRKCKHAAKKAIKKTGKIAGDVGKFIDKHKTEIIIGTAIVIAVGVTYGLGSAGVAALASAAAPEAAPSTPTHGRRKKEEEDAEPAGQDPEPPPREVLSLSELSARASPHPITENWVGDVVNSIARDLPPPEQDTREISREKPPEKPGFLKKMGGAVLEGLELVGRGVAGEPIDPQLQRHAALNEPESCIPTAPSEKERETKDLSKMVAHAVPPSSRTSSELPVNPNLFPSLTPPDRIAPTSSKNEKKDQGSVKKIEPVQPPVLDLFNKEQISKIKSPWHSKVYKTAGEQRKDKCIVYINGMNTTFIEGCENLEYLQTFIPDTSITWIYNHSNGAPIDVAEIWALNYRGIAPVTGGLIKQVWMEFYEKNKDNPDAVLLHVCHSQGALLTRIALLQMPPEVRKKIEIVAIAPAAIISNKWCFESYNYASSSDIVPEMGMIFDQTATPYEENYKKLIEHRNEVEEIHNELIVEESDSNGMKHDFRNEIYYKRLLVHINNYMKR